MSEKQVGFEEGKETNNPLYTLRTLIEKSVETQTNLYFCVIDYTNAFDKAKIDDVL